MFKIDKQQETAELHAKIIIQSQFIERLYNLFLTNGIFEELVHVAFTFQTFLQADMKSEVKILIMETLPNIVEQALTLEVQPWLVRTVYTISALALKQAVKLGILSESAQSAVLYSDIVKTIMQALTTKFVIYLQLEMQDEVVCSQNLFIVHTCTAVSEILKIQEATYEIIRDKETQLLNHTYAPDEAI